MSDLHAKIDWFAFTFPIALLGDKDEHWTLYHVLEMFAQHTAGRLREICGNSLWVYRETSGFYTHSIQHPFTLIVINWRAGNPFAQCVFSGVACNVVLGSITAAELALCANGRVTRMDVATDIQCDVTPQAFREAGFSERILSTSYIETPTGQTFYAGSRKGERMARVYRYHPPHPRANLLRVEVELKGDAAKMVCEQMKNARLSDLALSVNIPFAWKHPIWNPDKVMASKIPARAYDRDGAETLKWLNEVVASAIWKAHRSGLINLDEWLEEHFKASIG